jgi:acetyl-CoA C-acetyltransferase
MGAVMQEDGRFVGQIIPVTVTRKGSDVMDTTVESLRTLKPIAGRQASESIVTAGNASGQNDAASMRIVTTAVFERVAA